MCLILNLMMKKILKVLYCLHEKDSNGIRVLFVYKLFSNLNLMKPFIVTSVFDMPCSCVKSKSTVTDRINFSVNISKILGLFLPLLDGHYYVTSTHL